MRDLLESTAYQKLKKDPTTQVQTNLNEVMAESFEKHLESKNLYLRLLSRNGSAPGFYGLPKVRKPNVPLRLIVDFTILPLRALSNCLHRNLSPLVRRMPTNVRNASHFVELLSELKVTTEDREYFSQTNGTAIGASISVTTQT